MSMDRMREEFSKHCKQWRYREEVDENDFFVNAGTQRAWDAWVAAWQASRQALVVELPHTVFRGDYLQDGTSNLEWEEHF